MSSIVISADSLLDFFGALTLSNKGNDVYIYSGHDEIGDEPHAVTTLKGLATNADNTFFGSYVVEADSNSVDEFYLTAESIALIENVVVLINENCAPDEEEVADEDSDEDFYVAVKLSFDEDDAGDTKITISPSTGDRDTDRKFGGFLTQAQEENMVEDFPAQQVSRVIQGKGLDTAPSFVDREDADGNPVPVPDGNVTVWESAASAPLDLALKKARSMGKLPLAIQKHHSSRIHSIRIGDNWFGAVSPIPMNKADLSEQAIYADTESLNAEYDFTGLRDEDDVELVEPTQEVDDFEEEDFDEDEDVELEAGDEDEDDGEDVDHVESDDDQEWDDDSFGDNDDSDDDEEESLGLIDDDEEDEEDEDESSAVIDPDEEIARLIQEELQDGTTL